MQGMHAHTLHASCTFLVAKEITQPFTWANIHTYVALFLLQV